MANIISFAEFEIRYLKQAIGTYDKPWILYEQSSLRHKVQTVNLNDKTNFSSCVKNSICSFLLFCDD